MTANNQCVPYEWRSSIVLYQHSKSNIAITILEISKQSKHRCLHLIPSYQGWNKSRLRLSFLLCKAFSNSVEITIHWKSKVTILLVDSWLKCFADYNLSLNASLLSDISPQKKEMQKTCFKNIYAYCRNKERGLQKKCVYKTAFEKSLNSKSLLETQIKSKTCNLVFSLLAGKIEAFSVPYLFPKSTRSNL